MEVQIVAATVLKTGPSGTMLQDLPCWHWLVSTPDGTERIAFIVAKIRTMKHPTVQVGQTLEVRITPEFPDRCVVNVKSPEIEWISRKAAEQARAES